MPSPEWRKTVCNLCYVNCGIEVTIKNGRMVKVRGDKRIPSRKGYLCNKAARIPYYAHHKDRLTSPLRRRTDGSFDAISWEWRSPRSPGRVRDNSTSAHGGESFALYGGGGQGNHAGGSYITSPSTRARLPQYVFNALAQEKTGDFWVNGRMFGSQNCHTAEDVHHCDLLFVLGCQSLGRARLPQCA